MTQNYGMIMSIQSYKKDETKAKEVMGLHSNLELTDFKKCIDQIPTADESDLDFCNNQNNLKFNHMYSPKINSPEWGSDINEEFSINGTERTSELTTEHWSESKLCQSQKPITCVEAVPAGYYVNLPSL